VKFLVAGIITNVTVEYPTNVTNTLAMAMVVLHYILEPAA
jgi:hypothetical protein